MGNAADIFGTVFKNGSATLLARVVGTNGTPIQQAEIASAQYGIYLLDHDDPDAATAVLGHDGVSIDVSSLIFDTLQTDGAWDVDQTGYNFKHVLDISTNGAFTEAGRTYRIVFELSPAAGQIILVRFRVHAI
jgi:hypothetical protein